jgi:putative ABC transport system substrate-binding protein
MPFQVGVPGRLAILVNPNNPAAGLERDEVQMAARALGLQSATFELRQAEDFATVFDTIKGKAEALYVCLDPLFISNRSRISTLAVASQLPTMHDIREFVEVGRSDVLWTRLSRPVSTGWRPC